MAMCNVKWDVLVLIRDLWLMRVKDYLATSLWRKKVYIALMHATEIQSEVYCRIRPTVNKFSSLEADVFKPSFIFIKALTKR